MSARLFHHKSPGVTVHHGDCIEVMRVLPDDHVDAIVTDPPYGLGFMGKAWDDLPPGEDWARECLRVLKPGGHLLAFGGTRTWHRLACAIEDAGFEIRDSIAWLYGSGFPKSLDVSKAIDKAAGAEREVVGYRKNLNRTAKRGDAAAFHASEGGMFREDRETFADTAPATGAARTWQGWGTALKPAFEPIIVARKPLTGTVANNVQTWGTGALNIDACRIGEDGGGTRCTNRDEAGDRVGHPAAMGSLGGGIMRHGPDGSAGRWPANVTLDEAAAEVLDQQSGIQRDGVAVRRNLEVGKRGTETGFADPRPDGDKGYGGEGGASRFFYTAKAPTKERPSYVTDDGRKVAHPTVKPLKLMRWLVRLVTPPGGVVLEPFAGSGATIEAAILEGFQVIAVEREAEYLPLIEQRVERARGPVAAPAQVKPAPVAAATKEEDLLDLIEMDGESA